MKEKDCEDDYPYSFIYKINAKIYMIEYADSEAQIRGGEKVFMKFSEIKEWFFESNDYTLIVYNPEQSEDKHSEFIMNSTMPNFEAIAPMVQQIIAQQMNQNLVDEDPSSSSEDPSSEDE
jgi:hypothetical protein